MRAVVQAAFQQWTSADCGNGQKPNFVVNTFPDVTCTAVTGSSGYKSAGPNCNVWVFEDSNWVYGTEGESAIAVTTVKFSPTTGEIYDADVELNSEIDEFTTGLINVDWDLPSVVLHEAGHFLGMAHSTVDTAVMAPTLNEFQMKRTLTSDDMQGICAIYPPGQLNPQCDPEPRHGFSTECEFAKSGCNVAPGLSTQRYNSWGAMCLGVLLTAALRRRSRLAQGTSRRLPTVGFGPLCDGHESRW